MVSADGELPSYADARSSQSSSSALRTEHTYSLNTTKGKPWLSLYVVSRALSAKTLPVFQDGDEIVGNVRLDLDKSEGCKGVTIGILAENTTVGQEPLTFLDISKTLWEPSPSSTKLVGTQTWPFTLSLPNEVLTSASSREPLKNYALPPTVSERASPAYIDYKIIVTVKRGMLRVNQTLSTSFAYVPRSVAPTPSPLRIAAYRDGTSLIGPELDPEGWKRLPPFKVTGTLFDTKSVEIEAILSLANPLSYALGSPIPLILTLKSIDAQALDLLAQTSAQSIFLTRTTAIGSTATDDSAPRRSNNTFPEHMCRAYWWSTESKEEKGGSVTSQERTDNVRVLHGEIEVTRGLKPDFVFPRLAIRYHISVYPFSAAGLVPSLTPDHLLLSEHVSIVTDNPPGVIPRSHAPPGYVKPAEGNYNNSMGYLENGNQRFYHHHAGF